MRRSIFLLLIFLSALPALAAQEMKLTYAAPVLMPHTTQAMQYAGFWISRHPSPDAVIMSPDQIDQFNTANRQKANKDIFAIVDNLQTSSLVDIFESTFKSINEKNYYTAAGLQADRDFMDDILRNMHLSGVVMGMVPRYGVVVHATNQRLLPTDQGLYEQKGDLAFDQLQNSYLDIGTPVAVLHTSADGQWFYVMTNISNGWVHIKDIALGDINQVRTFAEDKDFAVVVSPHADIFLNDAMTEYYGSVRMGMRLPLGGIDADRATVNVPDMDKDGQLVIRQAYMNESDVHAGFLPFTARNIYQQAFAMLSQPYGWGGMDGQQDCSRFVQMVFATVGMELPRNSEDQALAGKALAVFNEKTAGSDKIKVLQNALAADTLLGMKGHILLYLGMVNGVPYAIHDTSGYGERIGEDRQITRSINRVVVSDLTLGEGSRRGSLLRRLLRVTAIE